MLLLELAFIYFKFNKTNMNEHFAGHSLEDGTI